MVSDQRMAFWREEDGAGSQASLLRGAGREEEEAGLRPCWERTVRGERQWAPWTSEVVLRCIRCTALQSLPWDIYSEVYKTSNVVINENQCRSRGCAQGSQQ